MIWKVKARLAPPVTRSRTKITVVSRATISTTNITGFFIINLGSSLTKESRIAGITIFGSSMVATGIRLLGLWTGSMDVTPKNRSEYVSGGHREVLDDGSERERREEGEAADDQDHADDETDEQTAGGRERPHRRRDRFLLRQRSGDRHGRDDHEE